MCEFWTEFHLFLLHRRDRRGVITSYKRNVPQCVHVWVGQDKRQLTRVGVKKGHSWFQKRWYKNEIIMIIFIIIILIIYVNIVVVVAVVDNFKN